MSVVINVGEGVFLPLSSVKAIKFDKTETTGVGKRRANVTFTDGTTRAFEECPKATEDAFYANVLKAE